VFSSDQSAAILDTSLEILEEDDLKEEIGSQAEKRCRWGLDAGRGCGLTWGRAGSTRAGAERR